MKTSVKKPPIPIYKVKALCNLCGKPMPTRRFYCSECHNKKFLNFATISQMKGTQSEIARQLGVSRQRIHQILHTISSDKQHGIGSNEPMLTDLQSQDFSLGAS